MQPLALCCFSPIVLLLIPGAAVCCGPTEYQWTTNEGSGCCPMCPPGKYLVSRCERFNEDPNCAVCPTGKYTAGWNTHSSCARCKICSEESGATYNKKCEKDSNAECSCGKGKQLTAESNSCEVCPPGSYSDEEGNKTCKPWTWRKLYLEMKKQDFYHCLGIKKDIKGPVQEESSDITSVQV
ncbi:hypothetical protein chiPu_0011156 [Chiloscyllium punctatum]|uniref:TNFR-Cys domain-containing protein n=1 Tax=Chiloscyllium punctatum TaxID=137246 RepID=A0A401SQP4_CHIPU|nr:hypothetical protein [Chiloscyllium punctatum]